MTKTTKTKKKRSKVSWLVRTRRQFARRIGFSFGVVGPVLLAVATWLRWYIPNGNDHIGWEAAIYWSIAYATTFGTGLEPKALGERLLGEAWMIFAITYWSAFFAAASGFFAGLLKR